MMMTITPYPWQQQELDQFFSDISTLAHAWLIHGEEGIGKLQFARATIARLLCDTPRGSLACEDCAACKWLQSGNHPDLRIIRPDALAATEGAFDVDAESESKSSSKKTLSKEIRVEQIRGIESWASNASHRGGYKIVLLYYAEMLNTISANALLKILEEPPPNTLFFLVTHQADRLLPTILSRCRRFPLRVPVSDRALTWLEQQGVTDAEDFLAVNAGAPIKAWDHYQSGHTPVQEYINMGLDMMLGSVSDIPLALVDVLEKTSPSVWLGEYQKLIIDCLLLAHGQAPRYRPRLLEPVQTKVLKLSAFKLQEFYQYLVVQQKTSHHPLNTKLLVYDALQKISQLR